MQERVPYLIVYNVKHATKHIGLEVPQSAPEEEYRVEAPHKATQ
jgi:hypothetical protein